MPGPLGLRHRTPLAGGAHGSEAHRGSRSRLFLESAAYRAEHFTTCEADRPLLVQFCANEPATLASAAKLVQSQCDGVDLNLGCPQRIAKRGNYGAYLMDDLPRVQALVHELYHELHVPVTVKVCASV